MIKIYNLNLSLAASLLKKLQEAKLFQISNFFVMYLTQFMR